jgi:ferredoxin-NADP reductase
MLVKVAAIIDETPRVKRFELVPSTGERLPPHTPGAHISVHIKLADGTADQRCYSIVNPPQYTGFYEIAVQREKESRGGSAFMHERVRLGDLLEVDEPKNHFALAEDADEHLLIAGGIGITPILCMARSLALSNRHFNLHYAAREPAAMAYRTAVAGVCGERVKVCFDGGDPGNGIDLKSLLGSRRPGLHAYVCGPAPMIDAVLATTKASGWPETAVHFELFNNPQAVQAGDQAIEVVLSRSGITLQVQPGQSILDSIIAAGAEADYDCKVGECGTCLTTVLEGMPQHRDYYLSDKERAEGTSMCTCVSWAKSRRLVLDL